MADAAEEKTRIFVVDDESLIRWSIRQRLEKAGFAVTAAESAELCLTELARQRPAVLIADVRLPGMDGVTLMRRARELYPDLPVIMMSAHGTVSVAVEAMKLGAQDFLTKPCDLAVVEATVRRTVENARLRRDLAGLSAERAAGAHSLIVGDGAAMRTLRELVAKVARSEASTVLIDGESGSGKDVVARAIHFGSRRAPRPFMAVNCTSLPEQLVESELFGHERGAFTDAKAQKKGLFELAEGGTLLLDEIGDMPAGAQAKLLRVIEEKRFKRVGGTVDLRVDSRIIAATHRDLAGAVARERFRQDLYFRLNVVRVHVPPLREHLEDLPALVAHFLGGFAREFKRPEPTVSEPALEAMGRHHWPGNIRELRNVLERAFILEVGDRLELEHLSPEILSAAKREPGGVPVGNDDDDFVGLVDAELILIRSALERARGNQSHAARLLGVSRDTLRYRMKKFGL